MNNNNDAPIQNISVFLRSSDYTYTNNDNKNDLIFELNHPIMCYSNMNMNIKLASFKFTNSFYTINNNNRNFTYQYEENQFYSSVFLNIGFYNVDNLLSYLNLRFYSTFLFTFDEITLKITIKSVLNKSFKLINNINNCLELLGFSDLSDTDYGISLTAPYLMNLMTTEILHINIPNVSINSIGLKNKRKYNILDSIHITSPPGESQTYYNNSNFHYKLSENLITKLNINILDQNFNIVDFNNIDWYLNLCISFSYIPQLIIPQNLNEHHQEINNLSMREELINEEYRILNEENKNI